MGIPGRYGDSTIDLSSKLSNKEVPSVPWGRWAGRDSAITKSAEHKDTKDKMTSTKLSMPSKDAKIPGRYGDAKFFDEIVKEYGRIPGRYGDENDIPGRYGDSKVEKIS